jgi:adenylate kinase
LPVVVDLELSEQVIRDRLGKRGRLDDNETAISQRYNDYQAVTKPLLDYLRSKDIRVIPVPADGTPGDVHKLICKALAITPTAVYAEE